MLANKQEEKEIITGRIAKHYDMLIDIDNDPARDPEVLRKYMDKWDGQAFIDAMELDKNKAVLEIGIGTGRLAQRVSPLCKELVGIDVSKKTIERAFANLAQHNNVELICADFMKYKFGMCFDVIYSSLTFMHIKQKQKAIDKIYGLLHDKGRFVLSCDKNKNDFIDAGISRIKIFPDKDTDIKLYINNAGFTLIRHFETEFANVYVCKK